MNLRTMAWKLKDGTISLLPRRGRVLQVTVGGHEAFWVNPKWRGDWNVGGDRLWVAPEVAWCWKSLKGLDPDQYVFPKEMDPGHWKPARRGKMFCEVRQQIRLRQFQKRAVLNLAMARSIRAVDLPAAPFFRQHVAYRTDNDLWIRGGLASQPVGLWSLIQVPNGGEMIVPCRAKPVFRAYFNPVAPRLWGFSGRSLRFQINGRDTYKVGVSPDVVTGQMAYVRRVGREFLVIHRTFFPQPWREYCDVPPTALQTQGDAVQIYNDGGALGGFGELEYHSPAIRAEAGDEHVADTNLTVVGLVRDRDWREWKRHWLGER